MGRFNRFKKCQTGSGRWAANNLNSRAYSQIKRPSVQKLIYAQGLATLVVACVASVFSVTHGYSALLGGLICALPNAWFAYRSFAFQGARAAQQIVKSFYRGEAAKFFLTALLFGLTFKFITAIEPLTLFAAFFAVQMVFWLTPLLINRNVSASG